MIFLNVSKLFLKLKIKIHWFEIVYPAMNLNYIDKYINRVCAVHIEIIICILIILYNVYVYKVCIDMNCTINLKWKWLAIDSPGIILYRHTHAPAMHLRNIYSVSGNIHVSKLENRGLACRLIRSSGVKLTSYTSSPS